ncbi:hypothetical protein AVEN_46172-1 [Araneus ventricosus]|uniref:Innexin n=1 Tax=Araneus ventricosus TaxID=182803 RepID=A0A4Y2RI35_ARAVE|nr:hypothetical protein AVEN_46172-1 [Araneus ventricosus]
MDLLSVLKCFFKTDSITIDNIVFRLHYKATAITLVAFSILVTARQYIGDPIDCIALSKVTYWKLLTPLLDIQPSATICLEGRVGVGWCLIGVAASRHSIVNTMLILSVVLFVLFLQPFCLIAKYSGKICEGNWMKNQSWSQ